MADVTTQFSEFKSLLATPDLPMLGPQRRPGTLGEADLTRRLADYFAAAKISPARQPLLRSAALLWHDHLDASHTISQGIETRDGSWLHGIMHRREPDYGNAQYWFRRVGRHEAFPELARRATCLLQNENAALAQRLIEKEEWMPFAFIDECERAERGKAGTAAALAQVQAAEFDVLVEHLLSR